MWLGHQRYYSLDNLAEVLGEQLVNFIEDEKFAQIKICDVFISQIENSTRGGDNDVHSLVETVEIIADLSAACADHTLNFLVLAEVLNHKGSLHGKLTGRHQHECLNLGNAGVDLLDERDRVGCSFTGSILGFGNDVLTAKDGGDGFLLNGGGCFEAHLVDTLNSKKGMVN